MQAVRILRTLTHARPVQNNSGLPPRLPGSAMAGCHRGRLWRTREVAVIDRARRDVLASLGGMAAASALRPPPLRAQEAQKRYRVAYLALAGDQDAVIVKRRLDELGYHDGRNLIFDFRSADGDQERLPRLAADLVATHPDVIVRSEGRR